MPVAQHWDISSPLQEHTLLGTRVHQLCPCSLISGTQAPFTFLLSALPWPPKQAVIRRLHQGRDGREPKVAPTLRHLDNSVSRPVPVVLEAQVGQACKNFRKVIPTSNSLDSTMPWRSPNQHWKALILLSTKLTDNCKLGAPREFWDSSLF